MLKLLVLLFVINFCHVNISFTIETEQNSVNINKVSIKNQLIVVYTPILKAFYQTL